jgi:hypothetical protein
MDSQSCLTGNLIPARRVIIKLKSRQNRVEFLAPGNLSLSLLRQSRAALQEAPDINPALTIAIEGLTIQ